MRSDAHSSGPFVETAAKALLRPVLKLLFDRGLSRRSLDGLCDAAYVEAASQTLLRSGGKITLKRVAERSGLSLARVRRLKRVVQEQPASYAVPLAEQAPAMAAASRIMTGWYSDPVFTDDEGRPLPCHPERERFQALIHRYGHGFAPNAIAELLLATGTVEANDQGELEPRARHVVAAPQSEALAHNLLEALVDLARAAEINQQRFQGEARTLQRTCTNDRIPRRMVPVFNGVVEQNAQSFLELIDDWLVQHEANENEVPAESLVRLGVGVYVISDE